MSAWATLPGPSAAPPRPSGWMHWWPRRPSASGRAAGRRVRLQDVAAVASDMAADLPRTDEVTAFLDLLDGAARLEN